MDAHPARRPRSTRPRAPRARTGLAAAALALTLSAVAAPAQAADEDVPTRLSMGQCAVGAFCVWSGTGYSGAFWSTAPVGWAESPVSVARSVWNRTAVDVRVYSGPGGTGSMTCWDAGAQTASTSVGSSSVRTMSATTC
jgi:hypothetical protein